MHTNFLMTLCYSEQNWTAMLWRKVVTSFYIKQVSYILLNITILGYFVQLEFLFPTFVNLFFLHCSVQFMNYC